MAKRKPNGWRNRNVGTAAGQFEPRSFSLWMLKALKAAVAKPPYSPYAPPAEPKGQPDAG